MKTSIAKVTGKPLIFFNGWYLPLQGSISLEIKQDYLEFTGLIYNPLTFLDNLFPGSQGTEENHTFFLPDRIQTLTLSQSPLYPVVSLGLLLLIWGLIDLLDTSTSPVLCFFLIPSGCALLLWTWFNPRRILVITSGLTVITMLCNGRPEIYEQFIIALLRWMRDDNKPPLLPPPPRARS